MNHDLRAKKQVHLVGPINEFAKERANTTRQIGLNKQTVLVI